MIRFCTTPLWNDNVTQASYPYLPECFRNTILAWIPIGLFWFLLPLWLSAVAKQHIKLNRLPVSILFLTKMIFSVLFLLVQVVRLIHIALSSKDMKEDAATWVTPLLYIWTISTILALMNSDRIKGIHASGLLFMFWLLVCLAILPDLIDFTIRSDHRMQCFTTWFQFLFALGSWWTHCFAETSSLSKMTLNDRPMVPEMFVSFPSRIFYSWVTPLIVRGYKTPLTEKDCWELPISERTVTVVQQVRRTLQTVYKKKLIVSVPSSVPEENHDLLKQENSSPRSQKQPIFWHALFRTYADKLFVGGLIKLTHDLCQFSGPMVLKLVLNFFTNPTAPKWLGIFYAILLSVTVFCQIVLLRAHYHCQFLVGIRFRSAITGLVYRKSLKLSNASKQQTTTGEIVNLMAIDAARFAEITHHMHTLWAGPLQLIIALVLLYQQMQLSIVPGVLLLFIMIPTNLFLQRIQKKLTAKQMSIKDQRIKAMNEILNGIRVLKLYAWEMAFIRSITHVRQQELGYILRKAIVSAISNILWTFTPILVGIMTFAAYVLSSENNVLTAEKAFVSLALFNLLRGPLVAFPNVISSVVEARVSNKRIQKFLNSDEVDEGAVESVPVHASNGYAIQIEKGFFRWSNNADDPLILKNIDLHIEHGALVALVGMVGSGKSSILAALLGEMSKVQGRVMVSGTIAYVPQTPWIMNTTLKENILFGRDFDQKWYDRVIDACALRHDLNMLPAKDLTEIGEKGINLSGGQRQRVSLARALYSNADIYLLDDPLSAVDAHVGAHIFKHVIGPRGLLANKTRLLVTHGVSHLSRCDDIVIVSQGEIIDHGNYQDLMLRSKILQDFVQSITNTNTHQLQRQLSDSDGPLSVPTTPTELFHNPLEMTANDVQQEMTQPTSIELEEKKKRLIEKETVHTGSVKWSIFSIYIRAGKLSMLALIFVFFCLTVAASLSANIWLSKWTDSAKDRSSTNHTSTKTNGIYYMNIYSTLGITQGLLTFAMQLIHKLVSFTAGRKLHWIILLGVLHAPMAFFDTTPIGRIINRFAKDIDAVDTTLPNAFSQSLTTMVTVVATLIILVYGSWFAILEFIPLAFLFALIQRLYVTSSRQLRRLDSVTRSLIYANFSETIQGLSSIRAYHAQDRFTEISDQFMDRNQSCHLASSVSNRWLGVRLEMIVNLLTLFAAITAVFMRDHLSPGTVGLMITYALQITHSLNLLVRMSSEIETNIVSVERIHEYASLTPEAPWEISETKPPSHWPIHGNIRMADLSTQYREHLPLVIKDLNLTITAGEKIGIIGRTGCGKSSLCLALFRIIEPTKGTIFIDDVDIRQIGLHDLRSRITIIPQDSVIFAGTVRFNLDPFGNYSDAEIWTALELVHLKERIHFLDHGLSHPLAEGGQNLSAGERQLLCLARALLRRSKIFILDEATAAIDMETDRLIQRTLRTAFKDATVLTIAHRLHTIIDSNKILVLSNGRLQEYDEPTRLASNPRSAFAKLLRDANIRLTDIA